jgi:hypothetical protein
LLHLENGGAKSGNVSKGDSGTHTTACAQAGVQQVSFSLSAMKSPIRSLMTGCYRTRGKRKSLAQKYSNEKANRADLE